MARKSKAGVQYHKGTQSDLAKRAVEEENSIIASDRGKLPTDEHRGIIRHSETYIRKSIADRLGLSEEKTEEILNKFPNSPGYRKMFFNEALEQSLREKAEEDIKRLNKNTLTEPEAVRALSPAEKIFLYETIISDENESNRVFFDFVRAVEGLKEGEPIPPSIKNKWRARNNSAKETLQTTLTRNMPDLPHGQSSAHIIYESFMQELEQTPEFDRGKLVEKFRTQLDKIIAHAKSLNTSGNPKSIQEDFNNMIEDLEILRDSLDISEVEEAQRKRLDKSGHRVRPIQTPLGTKSGRGSKLTREERKAITTKDDYEEEEEWACSICDKGFPTKQEAEEHEKNCSWLSRWTGTTA